MERIAVEALMQDVDLDALLAELVNRPAWHRQAACRGVGVDLFVIDQGQQYEPRARQMCAGCPVRQECLDAALSFGDRGVTGLWGGTTPTERRQLRRGVEAA